MSLSKIAGVVLSSAALVAGHGYVSGAVVDGTYYGGYLVTQYPYESNPPDTIGWSDTATDLGYVDGSSYASSDIICHKSAKPGAISAPVKAGGSVELQWTEWPESHHGPVITYMANCNGDCSSVDKTSLKFFKIDESGLIDDSSVPGTWASDNLISNNNSYTVTIPSTIESGNYVLRHEIIALHSAENTDGAQNYPQCFNLEVTGGGSDSPTGTLGTALYKDTDPGILVNIYQSLSSYTIPGPALYTGAASSSGSTTTAASVAATTTAAAATTAAPSSTSSTVASVGVISSASPVSATPVWSPSSIPPPHPYSTRLPRPSHGRRPGHGARPSGRPQFSQPSGPEDQPTASTVTDYATATEYATATVAAQFTDSPNVQTPSADDTVTVTASAGGQSAASSTPSSSSSDTSSSSSGSSSSDSSSSGSSSSGSTTTGSSSSSESSSYNSGDWSSYLSSLTADQFLSMLRQTMKWLVSDKKVHARDLRV